MVIVPPSLYERATPSRPPLPMGYRRCGKYWLSIAQIIVMKVPQGILLVAELALGIGK